MGGRESTTRKVSFGLDEEEKVTVLQGIKLSEDVLQRMREPSQPSDTQPPPKTESPKPDPGPPRPSPAEMQEELRRRFEREQARVREELARIAQRERDALPDDMSPAVLREKAKTREQLEKAQVLPTELNAWSKQLERKDAELKHLAAFYKEQLQLMEKKNMEHYQQASQMYNEAATKAEVHIKPRPTVPICPELQAQVLSCYKENRHQSLHCSELAKEYIHCIHSAKKNLMVNHG